ncbi:MAG: hypothetical protein A2015_04760 [Spirochaetes bacterium GWF1_31_7]|nr:MAG: hypothetical protein A2Y30_05140 [Spirochaetes bacterium GWE1_32_154]OHD48780.1 MAG: hypothetical protein A2Y29_03115 [Spirochaetes bacterium GWE2_31_10]OHD52843.1 MAG: hypothetical protein A2015_04760 [Spirochaetes bacterium GWF1_31_7]OHD74149.1 MAG: hypothetical protein A2355_14030 [Spirochaetes bacterium RIFOXYB1_FULL_32_8]HBD95179.1 chemotaxis protein CheR [Spirochaetia bacterium]
MELTLSDTMFKKITKYLYDKTGITLKDYKKYLVINRLSKFVGYDKEYKTYEDFFESLVNDKTGALFTIFTNSLTTNFSFFFREPESFQFLTDFLKDRDQKEDYIRLWSAASSTGEEGYSMAITAINALPDIKKIDFKILGTDISNKVLSIAEQGTYKIDKIKTNILKGDLNQYFTKDGEFATVKNEVKRLIAFRYLNLLDHYPFKKQFDVIFLRNVLIYFDEAKKEIIVNKVAQYLKPDGVLVLGLSESLVGIKHPFKQGRNSIYKIK